MKVFESVAKVPTDFADSAVTIGKFDGVHTGHRAVIDRLQLLAEDRELQATVITFDKHPLAVLDPEHCPPNLLSGRQKLERLADAGVAATLVLPFDRAFSEQAPDDFIRKVLVDSLHAKLVLVGSDFRYGAKGKGNVDTLRHAGREHGFEVELVDDVRAAGVAGEGRRASSSWVRESLAAGKVSEAASVLGYLPAVRSIVVPGEKRGRELGFPTANLQPNPEGLIPADGVYAGWLTVAGATYPAAISVGNNPTFDGVPERQVEAYVLDQDIDLYGQSVEVAFAEFIRGMVKFDSVDALVVQLRNDVAATRELLRV